MVKVKECIICSKDREIGEIHAGVQYIKEIVDDIKENRKIDREDIKENTEFRQNAKGIIGGITFISMLLGGSIIWLIKKIWGN